MYIGGVASLVHVGMATIAMLVAHPTRQPEGSGDLAARVQTWVDEEWERSQRLPELPGASLRWRIEDRYVPTASELEAIRREVANRPDHPDRELLARSERRLANGPDICRYELWLREPDAWRVCKDLPGGFWDTTLAGGSAWMLSTKALSLGDPVEDKRSGGAYVSERSGFSTDVSCLITGGFGLGGVKGAERSACELNGDRWEFTATTPASTKGSEPRIVRFVGHWDGEVGRWFTILAEVVGDSPPTQRSRWEFQDWQWNEPHQRYVAGTVRFVSKQLDRLIVFEGSRPEPDGGFDALTRVPEEGGVDVLRGEVRPPIIQDRRSGLTRTRQPDGSWTETRMERSGGETDRAGSAWRWVGLGALLVLAAIGAVLWRAKRV